MYKREIWGEKREDGNDQPKREVSDQKGRVVISAVYYQNFSDSGAVQLFVMQGKNTNAIWLYPPKNNN